VLHVVKHSLEETGSDEANARLQTPVLAVGFLWNGDADKVKKSAIEYVFAPQKITILPSQQHCDRHVCVAGRLMGSCRQMRRLMGS
jgi:hypothetical protein